MRGARPNRALALLFAREKPFAAGEHVLVALSGGSDSTALAALAQEHARELQTRLTLVHVHHGLRPSADQDESVACAIAAHLSLPIVVCRVGANGSDEATLRELRYSALIAEARRVGATRVLTGHTAQDQTETVLLALFRGTGPEGICGMPVTRRLADGLVLVRPLLRADRAMLRQYCEREHLPYVEDPTNANEAYRRNALRRMLAELRPAYPGLDRAVARCAKLLRDERSGDMHALRRAEVRIDMKDADTTATRSFALIDAAAARRGPSS